MYIKKHRTNMYVNVWTELKRFRIGANSGILWTCQWRLRLHILGRRNLLPPCSGWKTQTEDSCATLVTIYKTTRRLIPEDRNINKHRRESLKHDSEIPDSVTCIEFLYQLGDCQLLDKVILRWNYSIWPPSVVIKGSRLIVYCLFLTYLPSLF
jgi:hypothetical protein